MNKFNITIGSDPEVFVEKNGKIISGIGMIPGSKWDPHPITDKGHFIQTDNIAFEFNIPPCKTEDEFVENIIFVRDYLKTQAKANDCILSTKSSGSINPKELKHPQAQEFGCDPDYDVYIKDINPKPKCNDKNFRCTGGHIHIGYPNPTIETTEKIVKAFDMFVVMPAMFRDPDNERRKLYGKAGSFRFKDPWGLECRALSNFWIHTEENIRWVYQQTILAVNKVLEEEFDSLMEKYSEQVKDVINNNDKEGAMQLIRSIHQIETV